MGASADVVRAWLACRLQEQEGELLLAEDVLMEEPASLPYGGTFVGHAQLKSMHDIMRQTWHIDFPPEGEIDVIESGDTVVLRGTLRAASVRTGRRVETPVAEFYRVHDGLIRSIRVHYMDTAAMVVALTE
jgi:uncharacterized protein